MGSFSAIPDLAEGDLVTEAYMDALRANETYLLNPNHQATDTFTFTTTTGTTWADIAGASAVVTAHGGPILAMFNVKGASAVGGSVTLDLLVDGASQTSTSGIFTIPIQVVGVGISRLVTGQASGVHTLKIQWKAAAGTYTGALTGNIHFAAIEL